VLAAADEVPRDDLALLDLHAVEDARLADGRAQHHDAVDRELHLGRAGGVQDDRTEPEILFGGEELVARRRVVLVLADDLRAGAGRPTDLVVLAAADRLGADAVTERRRRDDLGELREGALPGGSFARADLVVVHASRRPVQVRERRHVLRHRAGELPRPDLGEGEEDLVPVLALRVVGPGDGHAERTGGRLRVERLPDRELRDGLAGDRSGVGDLDRGSAGRIPRAGERRGRRGVAPLRSADGVEGRDPDVVGRRRLEPDQAVVGDAAGAGVGIGLELGPVELVLRPSDDEAGLVGGVFGEFYAYLVLR